MPKSVKTVTGQRGTVINVPGSPKDITLNGSTYTIWYEPKPTSCKVQEYHSYDAIPDSSAWLGRFGSEPNSVYVYFSD